MSRLFCSSPSEPVAPLAGGAPVKVHGATKTQGAPKDTPLGVPPITAWSELRVCLVDGETVRLDGAGKYARLTYHDLGLANLKNRVATSTWKLLVLICEGEVDWKKIAPSRETLRKHYSNLRKVLKGLFGIEDDPFVEHEGDYRPRFRARVGCREMGKA